ncbi:MAG TPA: YezD family protein [Vicinamibacteria bacterium]|nr:YezD family protein [Vicinamibacteria bacterium]
MSHTTEAVDTDWERAVMRAIRALRYGSVEIVVHEGRVVQIETREKVRFDEAGRRRPDIRGRE